MTSEEIHADIDSPCNNQHISPTLPWDRSLAVQRRRSKGKQKAVSLDQDQDQEMILGIQSLNFDHDEDVSIQVYDSDIDFYPVDDSDDDYSAEETEAELAEDGILEDEEDEEDEEYSDDADSSVSLGSLGELSGEDDDSSSIVQALDTLVLDDGLLEDFVPTRYDMGLTPGSFPQDILDAPDWSVYEDPGVSGEDGSADDPDGPDPRFFGDGDSDDYSDDDHAGPMAHAVRPDSFIEISNFYTLTVYEKGSEVVGMIHTLLGAEGFRKGSDLYFERHDGQAVTCDDFIKAMEDANGADLSQFKRWYSQAGTPRLAVSESFDAAAKTYSLTFRQSCPETPDKVEKLPFVIPVELGLLDGQGAGIALRLADEAAAGGTSRVISVTQAEQTFTFVDIAEKPLPSLLRGFSAPVKLSFPYNRDQLMFLMQHDSDGFNRWDADQQLSVQVLQELIAQHQQGQALKLDQRLIDALRSVLSDESLDQAMVAEMLSLPSEAYLTEISEVADVEAIHAAREYARKQLADNLFEALWLRYQANRELSKKTPYVAAAEHFARRALQNIALSYLMLSGKPEVVAATLDQFDTSDNMTERLTALAVLVNSPFEAEKAQALAVFAENFKDNPLVMDQWFSVQSGSTLPGGLARVKALMEHSAFNIKNPNKVRALVGAFAGQNLINFHAADGSGYRFLADLVIQLNGFNPQIASRQLAPLTRWRKYDSARQALMKAELERIRASGELSSDVFEVVSKSLA